MQLDILRHPTQVTSKGWPLLGGPVHTQQCGKKQKNVGRDSGDVESLLTCSHTSHSVRTTVGEREILRNHERNKNSPATGPAPQMRGPYPKTHALLFSSIT